MSMNDYRDFGFRSNTPSHMHRHFLPPLFELCGARLRPNVRVLDVGCGNGYTAGQFAAQGCNVTGIDLSETGLSVARAAYPNVRFECLAADDHILTNLGVEPFDIVISNEVIEHLYDPQAFSKGCYHALCQGGRFIVSTPYHGYLKNLALAALNKFDRHFNPLRRGGHIKFWTRKTLSHLLAQTGFVNLQFRGAGRIPYLWMTMLIAADRPEAST
jgi:2-polyprenyl-3-methyl-5-hydroxy-6-metoxy-1,4-benzoquinol methylase